MKVYKNSLSNKKLILSALLIFFSFFLFSVENENLFKDPLVIKVCEELAKNKNTVGDFSQTKTITQSGRKLKSIGKFIISDMGIVWKTEKPFASTLVISENKMVQTSASGKKTVMDGTDNQIFQSISSVLSSLFMGNTEKLYENFEIVVKNSDFPTWNIGSIFIARPFKYALCLLVIVLSSSRNSRTSFTTIKCRIYVILFRKQCSMCQIKLFVIVQL